MIDETPTPNSNIEVIFDSDAIDHTYCGDTTSQKRIKICKKCNKFQITNNRTVCSEQGWDINLMSTSNELKCPLEKW